MPNPPRTRRVSWILVWILLGVYFFLKLMAWGYAWQVRDLERQMAELRPALSAKVLYDQLESTHRACIQVSDQVRQMDLQKKHLLEELSELPASITLERVEAHSRLKDKPTPRPLRGLRIEGSMLPGIRSPEAVLTTWAQKMEVAGTRVRIQKLIPSQQTQGLWRFELLVEDA